MSASCVVALISTIFWTYGSHGNLNTKKNGPCEPGMYTQTADSLDHVTDPFTGPMYDCGGKFLKSGNLLPLHWNPNTTKMYVFKFDASVTWLPILDRDRDRDRVRTIVKENV